MSAAERNTAVGVFETRDQAERAVAELERAGFTDEHVGYASPGEAGTGTTTETHGGAAEGLASGLVSGGVLGGIIGAAAALLLPGIGPIVAGGILASALGGAAVGAVAGGILGALTGMGVPEHEARYYEDEFRAGRPIVTVRANGRYSEAVDILRRNGAYDVDTRGGGSGRSGAYDVGTSNLGSTGAATTAGAAGASMAGAAGASSTTLGPAGVVAPLGAAGLGVAAASRATENETTSEPSLADDLRRSEQGLAGNADYAAREAVDDTGDVVQGAADTVGAHGVARNVDRATENEPGRGYSSRNVVSGVENAGREAVDDAGDVAEGTADALGAHGTARNIDRATENDPNRRV